MGKKGHAKHPASKSAPNDVETRPLLSAKKKRQLDRLVDDLWAAAFVPFSKIDKQWEYYLSICKLLDGINTIQFQIPTVTPKDRHAAIDDFVAWMKSNGAKFEGIEIADFPGYDLGLKATKEFAQGEPILNVPRKLMLTEESAKKSVLGDLVNKDRLLQCMPNVILAMYLLLQKFTANTFWKPYIDVLPTSYTTVLYFSPEDMKTLEGSPSFKSSLKFCVNIARQYAYFYKLLQKSDDDVSNAMKNFFTYKEYCWAVSTAITRLNNIPSEANPAENVVALIPLWDMCNHTSGEITTDFNPNMDQAECFALRDFKVDDQVFIFYGIRTNAFFFQYNGFVYPENQHDSLKILLGISPDDPLQSLKKELLGKIALNGATEFSLGNVKEPISHELMAFARVFVMDKDELNYYLSTKYDYYMLHVENCEYIKKELDKKAYNFIHMRCRLLASAQKRLDDAQLIEKLAITEKTTEKSRLQRNESHRNLAMQLKEHEMKLFQRAIEYTKTKL